MRLCVCVCFYVLIYVSDTYNKQNFVLANIQKKKKKKLILKIQKKKNSFKKEKLFCTPTSEHNGTGPRLPLLYNKSAVKPLF